MKIFLNHFSKLCRGKTHIFCNILSSWFEPKKCKRNACVLTVYPPGHPWNVGGMILVLKCARAYNRGGGRGKVRNFFHFKEFEFWRRLQNKQWLTLNCFRVMNYASNLSNQLHKWIIVRMVRKNYKKMKFRETLTLLLVSKKFSKFLKKLWFCANVVRIMKKHL